MAIRVKKEHEIVPQGKYESEEDFNLRRTFQGFCSLPVLPRSSIEERGAFINRILLSRDM